MSLWVPQLWTQKRHDVIYKCTWLHKDGGDIFLPIWWFLKTNMQTDRKMKRLHNEYDYECIRNTLSLIHYFPGKHVSAINLSWSALKSKQHTCVDFFCVLGVGYFINYLFGGGDSRAYFFLMKNISCLLGYFKENLSPMLFSIFLNDLAEFLGSTSKGGQIELNVENLDCFIKLCFVVCCR